MHFSVRTVSFVKIIFYDNKDAYFTHFFSIWEGPIFKHFTVIS
ncbi:hypothetical protein BTN50_1147 [Candidatus Enterovibrio altilux]|uniref:Uncharacterized protein n=1 Tax=Candidatus Enterovibrio altilux TaxID=1927128 RepID=A0A291B9E5_9GAMM|nr:hypothetical protein BTN50_1147 [Candidatus Enterovibrio luxaltus]